MNSDSEIDDDSNEVGKEGIDEPVETDRESDCVVPAEFVALTITA